MTNPRIDGLRGLPEPEPPKRPQEVGGGARFEALLERLSQHASHLREAASGLDKEGGLSQAVDASRASVEDARALHQELLEALRARLQNKPY